MINVVANTNELVFGTEPDGRPFQAFIVDGVEVARVHGSVPEHPADPPLLAMGDEGT